MEKQGSRVKEKGKVAPGNLDMTQKHLCFYPLKGQSIPSEGAGSVFGMLNLTRASGGTPHLQIFTFRTHFLMFPVISQVIPTPFACLASHRRKKLLRKEVANASLGLLLLGHMEQWVVSFQNKGVTHSFLIIMGMGSAWRHSCILRGTWKIVTMLTPYVSIRHTLQSTQGTKT